MAKTALAIVQIKRAELHAACRRMNRKYIPNELRFENEEEMFEFARLCEIIFGPSPDTDEKIETIKAMRKHLLPKIRRLLWREFGDGLGDLVPLETQGRKVWCDVFRMNYYYRIYTFLETNKKKRETAELEYNLKVRKIRHYTFEPRDDILDWFGYDRKYEEHKKDIPLSVAFLIFYRLNFPFTYAELKTEYKEIMKREHPDVGGSAVNALMIQDAYEALKPLAM